MGTLVSGRTVLHDAHDTFVAAETSGIEATMPILARKVARGEPLYEDWRVYPHEMAVYGPLFYDIPGWIARWTRLSGWRTWILGREISGVAAIATILLAVLAMVRRGVRPYLVVLGVVLIIPILGIWDIAATFRPDMPMIALSLGGVLLAGDWRGRWRWLSLVPLLAALAYKQTAIAAPAAIVATLLLTRRPGDALRFAAAFCRLRSVCICSAMQLRHPRMVFRERIRKAAPGLLCAGIRDADRGARGNPGPPRCDPRTGVCWSPDRPTLRRPPSPVRDPVPWARGRMASGRRGSDVNYFVEALVVLAILAVMLAESAFRAYAQNGLPRAAGAVALALLVLCYIPGNRFPPSPEAALPDLSPDATERVFTDAIAPLHGARVFPGELEVAVMAGLDVPYSDGFITDAMTVDGLLDPNEVLRDFQAQHYDYVALPDFIVMYQHTYPVPRVLLREIQHRIDLHAGVRIAPLSGGRSVYLFRLAPPDSAAATPLGPARGMPRADHPM